MEISDIMLPAFAYAILAQHRCEACSENLRDAWVRSAGARLDSESCACFFMKVWCKSCETARDFTITSRKFQRNDWWNDLAAWSSDAARPDRVGMVLSKLAVLPQSALLLKARGKIRRLELYGGYAGDAGPVLLMYRGLPRGPEKAYGVARLERGDRVRFLPVSDRDVLGVAKWSWFAGIGTGTTFTNKYKTWTKLTAARIADIVRDRVFEPWTATPRRRGGSR